MTQSRVEAEIARLERELASERGQGPLTSREREHLARAEAAEAEVARWKSVAAAEAEELERTVADVARLRDGLRRSAEGEEHLAARARSDADYEVAAIHSYAASVLRVLLADQDGAA